MTKRQMDARRKALDEFLSETYGDDIVHFGGPEFDGGIVGVTTDGRLVYSYEKLAERKRKKPLDPARGVVIQYGAKS